MLDTENTTHTPSGMQMSGALQLECRALAEVPHKFRAVSSWLNYNTVLVPQIRDATERALLIEDMKLARRALDDVMVYFDVTSNLPDHDPAAVIWFRNCLRQTPGKAQPFHDFAALLHRAQHAAEHEPDTVLAVHREISSAVVHTLAPEVTALLTTLDREMAALEQDRMASAEAIRHKADESVSRILSISQMVRLISLNASVEAARAGEAGKAFGVIAAEVKALSEAIQQSATQVSDTVKDLSDRL